MVEQREEQSSLGRERGMRESDKVNVDERSNGGRSIKRRGGRRKKL